MTYNRLIILNAVIIGLLLATGLAFTGHNVLALTGNSYTGSDIVYAPKVANSAKNNAQTGRNRVLASVFGTKETKKYQEVVLPKNAQTLPLLQAPKNIDPQARTSSAVMVVNDSALSNENSGIDGNIDVSSDFKPTSDQISVYTVRNGDTLEQIAEMYDVNVKTIRLANDLSAKESIKPGMVLVISPVAGVIYETKQGDTIAKIAKAYGANAQKVADFNDMSETQVLAAKTRIIIPDGEDAIGLSHDTPEPGKTIAKTPVKNIVPVITASAGYFSRPVKGGIRTQGIHGRNGVDIASSFGTPIYAAAGGKVTIARTGYNGGYGTYVVIDHPNGTQTLYGHMSALSTSVGSQVEKGQQIGSMGSTGKSTGVHVHFEVRNGKNPF